MPWQSEATSADFATAESVDGLRRHSVAAAFAACGKVAGDYCTDLFALASCCIGLVLCLLAGCRMEAGCSELKRRNSAPRAVADLQR